MDRLLRILRELMMGEIAGEEPGANTHGHSRTYTQKFYSALQLLVVDVCILQAF